MKTRSTFISLLFATATFAFLSNCSGSRKEEHTETHEHQGEHASGSTEAEASDPQFQVDPMFQKQLADVFDSYVKLKDAFVASDAVVVKAEATNTSSALDNVDMKLITGAAHNDWMNYSASIEASLNEIKSADNIDAQRQSFSTLSDNLYKSIKAFGLGGKEAFYEFCPMAFNNEGAYWLSDKPQIRNPYFGDEMLTCGVVKEKLK